MGLSKLQYMHFFHTHGIKPVDWVIKNHGDWIKKLYSSGRGRYSIADEKEFLNRVIVGNVIDELDIARSHQEAMSGDTNPMNNPEMVEAMRGERNPMHGLSPEETPLWGITGKDHPAYGMEGPSKGITGEDHVAYGYEHTEEAKKKISEARSGENHHYYGVTGSDHPTWKGGSIPTYSLAFQHNREDVIERDGEQCVICGLSRGVHKEKYGKDIEVHHIIPRRQFRSPDGSMPDEAGTKDNLITLCVIHHRRAEFDGIELPGVTG